MVRETRLHLASRIRLRRETLRLSQRELADRLEVGVAELEEIENGRRQVGPQLLLKLAEHLAVPLRYFFTDELHVTPREGRQGFEEARMGFAQSDEIVRLVSAFDAIVEPENRRSVIDLAEALALNQLH